MKEALFYKKVKDEQVECFLCAQNCRINPGKRGKCGVRENRDGVLWSLVYEQVIAENVDPIEKKPLYHFFPGSRSYSIATSGCNLSCLFCQNSDISQSPRAYKAIYGVATKAKTIVERALNADCASIAYTYTEPTIFLEYVLDVAAAARDNGIRNVFISNGFMTEAALDTAAPLIDAANIDLKAFSDNYYREQCGARLEPVLKTLKGMKERGIWLEVTTLIIPGLNDDPAQLRELASFIADMGRDIPWHVSRFYPTYLMTDRPPTPVSTIRMARQIGIDAGLIHVYTGNVPGEDGENTICHNCGAIVIERRGYSIDKKGLNNGACAKCLTPIEGIGMK
jgi:pyruvate formate lyase activating enzyme